MKVGLQYTRPWNLYLNTHSRAWCASSLLCVIVTEVITKEHGGGLLWELFYTDSLILMAESEESLCEKIVKQKSVN